MPAFILAAQVCCNSLAQTSRNVKVQITLTDSAAQNTMVFVFPGAERAFVQVPFYIKAPDQIELAVDVSADKLPGVIAPHVHAPCSCLQSGPVEASFVLAPIWTSPCQGGRRICRLSLCMT